MIKLNDLTLSSSSSFLFLSQTEQAGNVTYFPFLCDYAELTKLFSLSLTNIFSDMLFIFRERRARLGLPERMSLGEMTDKGMGGTKTPLWDS